MNIEIANRLVELRKKNNLSQEALAGKLGISRQAVSKWERAEASPDTDNLILLARLYGVSLDELLKTDDEILPIREEADECEDGGNGQDPSGTEADKGEEAENIRDAEMVHVGPGGVHVKDKDGEVHVGWDGIHVSGSGERDDVHIDKNGIVVNGEKYNLWLSGFPMTFLIVIVYVSIGCIWNAWHPGWLLFFLVPIWESLLVAIRKRNAYCFAYPVLAVLIYLCLGFFFRLWHPGWIVFLTIPLCYSVIGYFRGGGHEE